MSGASSEGEPRWVACELHTHTVHSDGGLTVVAMARELGALGVEAIALTDHNTTSGLPEMAQAELSAGVTMIPGMELTTFYGHLVSLGTADYIEWRSLTKGDVNAAIDAIHAHGGLAGVAHPFHPGSPFCTGCFWEFEGLDWTRPDYLEVWSEPDPWSRSKNHRAFALWNDLLRSGFRVAAVGGTDFHRAIPNRLPSVTYVGVEGGAPLVEGVKDAIRRGRVFVTLGPLLSMDVRAVGSRIEVEVRWRTDHRRRLWEPHLDLRTVELHADTGRIAVEPLLEPAPSHRGAIEGSRTFSVGAGLRWIRAELRGLARGDESLIAFTNPAFLHEE